MTCIRLADVGLFSGQLNILIQCCRRGGTRNTSRGMMQLSTEQCIQPYIMTIFFGRARRSRLFHKSYVDTTRTAWRLHIGMRKLSIPTMIVHTSINVTISMNFKLCMLQ
jgi:hypothetical protein